MKFSLLVLASLVAAVTSAKSSTPAGWTDDYDAALKQAAAEKKHVLVDFSGSDWCGWCKRLDKEVFDTDAFRKEAPKNFVLLMVDSPRDKSLLSEKAKQQNPGLVKKFKVRGFPTVLVLDAKGEVVHQTGYRAGGPENYLKMLETEIKYGPDIQKYIKPIEELFEKYVEEFHKTMGEVQKSLDKDYPALKDDASAADKEKREKTLKEEGERRMFAVVGTKVIPLLEETIAKAKAMKVPDHLKEKKDSIISRHEGNLAAMKEAKAKFDKGEPLDK